MNVQIKGVRVTCPFKKLERGQMFVYCHQVSISNCMNIYIKTDNLFKEGSDHVVNSVNLSTGESVLFPDNAVVRPLVDTSITSKVCTE